VPAGNGYTKIYSNSHAFATLKADGSIIEWRTMHFGSATAPELPHAVIEPSALRATKALEFE
jgi:hypothetical protein